MQLTRRSLLARGGRRCYFAGHRQAAPLGSKSHVAVIGAGVFGAWTAHHLLRAGHRVTLVDAARPGATSRASSGGEIAPDPRRLRQGRDLHPHGARLAAAMEGAERDRRPADLHPHRRAVLLPDATKPISTTVVAAHRQLGLPSEAARRRRDGAALPDDRLHRRQGRPVRARLRRADGAPLGADAGRALRPRRRRPIVRGAAIPPAAGASGNLDVDHAQVGRTDRRRPLRLRARPVAAQGSFPTCSAAGSSPPARKCSSSPPPAGDRRFLPGAMPSWADFNGGDIFYGFPDLESRGVKFAHDAHGAEVDPDTQDRRPSAGRAGGDRRLPRPPLPVACAARR